MDTEAVRSWMHDQLRANGWTDVEIARGRKYETGGRYVLIGILLGILIITLPIGFPLFVFGLYRIRRYGDPGSDYKQVKVELLKEHKRRDKNGEPLWDDVDDDWWENRLPPA